MASSLEAKIQKLLDYHDIEDTVAKYSWGQDFHQPSTGDIMNMMEHWSEVFASDATIDYSDAGFSTGISVKDLVKAQRGTEGEAGIPAYFSSWHHLASRPVTTLKGADNAHAVSQGLFSHPTKEPAADGNAFAALYMHDDLERRPEGWRIVHRRMQLIYTNVLQRNVDSALETADLKDIASKVGYE